MIRHDGTVLESREARVTDVRGAPPRGLRLRWSATRSSCAAAGRTDRRSEADAWTVDERSRTCDRPRSRGLRPQDRRAEPSPGPTPTTWGRGVEPRGQAPSVDQVEQLRKTINEKNLLFFYRWRPQNDTYLFGFRKHEQGNNAIEIPRFDPLVEAKETEIARLRKPVPQLRADP